MSTINRTGVQAAAQFVPPPPPKPEPKPLPEIEASAQAAPPDLLSGISERLGFDAGSFAKAKFNSLIDRAQNVHDVVMVTPQTLRDNAAKLIETAKQFDPSSLGKPLTLDPNEIAAGAQKLGEYAAKGAEILYNKARERVQDAVEPLRAVNIHTMEDGDVIKVGSKTSINAGPGGSLEGMGEIKRSKDPETGETVYTVSLEMTPEATGSLGIATGSLAPGGKIEYKCKSPEDVDKLMQIHGKAMQCKVDANGSGMTAEEAEFVQKRLSSVEVKVSGGAQAEGAVKLGPLKVGVTPGVKVTGGMKLEFKDGKPVALVRTSELSGSGVGKAGLNLINSKSDGKGLEEGSVRSAQIEGKGTITVETKIPLEDVDAKDALAMLTNPAYAPMLDKADTTIKVASDVDGGANGTMGEMEISDLSADEAKRILDKTLQGKPAEAFDGTSVKVKLKTSVYEDRGVNVGVGIKIGGWGVEYEARAERRHELAVKQSEFTIGTAAK